MRFQALILSLVFCFVTDVQAAGGDYPYQDPYLATLTVRLMKSRTNAGKSVPLPAIPGRENTDIVGSRARELTATVFPVSGSAKVLFLIPGTGGSDKEGAAAYLAEEFNAAGLHVIILPSPMNWKFNLASSTHALAGDPLADAADLYLYMLEAVKAAKQKLGLKVNGYAVAGYSLGALNAFFVDRLDKNMRGFNFSHVLMLYPPTDVGSAIQTMDRLNALGDQWDGATRNSIWGYVFGVGSGLLNRDINKPDYFENLDTKIKLSRDEVGYLIGNSFRQTLADVIFVGQMVQDLGILKSPVSASNRTARMNEISKYNFTDYLQVFVFPFFAKLRGFSGDLNAYLQTGSLMNYRSVLAQDVRYRMIHSPSDFLSAPSQVAELKQAMGDRAVIFNDGGHMGNLWFEPVKQEMKALMLR